MFYWRRMRAGVYHAYRNGGTVAICERTKDHGEPAWKLSVLDGTTRKSASGREVLDGTYPTLGEAKFAYGHAYRMAHTE